MSRNVKTNREIINCREVASITGMSLSWVYLHLQPDITPRLPHFRIGTVVKFRRSQIEEFMRMCEIEGELPDVT